MQKILVLKRKIIFKIVHLLHLHLPLLALIFLSVYQINKQKIFHLNMKIIK